MRSTPKHNRATRASRQADRPDDTNPHVLVCRRTRRARLGADGVGAARSLGRRRAGGCAGGRRHAPRPSKPRRGDVSARCASRPPRGDRGPRGRRGRDRRGRRRARHRPGGPRLRRGRARGGPEVHVRAGATERRAHPVDRAARVRVPSAAALPPRGRRWICRHRAPGPPPPVPVQQGPDQSTLVVADRPAVPIGAPPERNAASDSTHDAGRALAAPALPRRGAARGGPGPLLGAARGRRQGAAGLRARLQPRSRHRHGVLRRRRAHQRREPRARAGVLGPALPHPRDRRPRRLDQGHLRGRRRRLRDGGLDHVPHGRSHRRERREAGARAVDRARALRRRRVARLRRPVAHGRGGRGVPRERPVHPPGGLRPLQRLREGDARARRAQRALASW